MTALADLHPILNGEPHHLLHDDQLARLTGVRDALRAVAALAHDGDPATWCDEPAVNRGDLAALFALLGEGIEAGLPTIEPIGAAPG